MEQKRIDSILEKYWAGESSLEDEQLLRAYFSSTEIDPAHLPYQALFAYYAEASNVAMDKSPIDFVKKETKVISLSSRLPAIAAAVIILFAAVIGFQHLNDELNNTPPVMTAEEIIDADEAYEITKEALAYLSLNYKKGADPLSVLPKSIESTKIFK